MNSSPLFREIDSLEQHSRRSQRKLIELEDKQRVVQAEIDNCFLFNFLTFLNENARQLLSSEAYN